MSKRVVITGIGAVTPIGNSVNEFWGNLKKGKNGISEISLFDTEKFNIKLAAETNIDLNSFFTSILSFIASDKLIIKYIFYLCIKLVN